MLAGGLVVGGLVPLAGSAAATTGHLDWVAAGQFVGQINWARTSHGRPRLTVSSALTSVAASWTMSMARSNRLAHNPNLASSVRGWHVLAENVGVGPSVSSLESAFYGSAPHRANMLDSTFTLVGVAVVDVGGKLWVTELFEQPAHPTTVRHKPSARPGPTRTGVRLTGPSRSSPDPTAQERARRRQLERLFAARHDLKFSALTAHMVRERSQPHS